MLVVERKVTRLRRGVLVVQRKVTRRGALVVDVNLNRPPRRAGGGQPPGLKSPDLCSRAPFALMSFDRQTPSPVES